MLLRPVVRRFECIEPKYRGDWINRVVATTHAAIAGFICLRALLSEPPFAGYTAALLRWDAQAHGTDFFAGSSAALAGVLPLTMGYMCYDCAVMCVDPVVYMPLMAIHHVVSLAFWPVALHSRCAHFFVLQLLSTELTSVLLHPAVFFLPKHGFKGTPLHTAAGLALLASFTVLRILPIPFLAHAVSAAWAHLLALPTHLLLIVLVSFPIPPVLNLFWYSLLVKGALKSLGVLPSKKTNGD